MDHHDLPEIAAFPDLFAGMEQFFADEFAQFKRTGTVASILAMAAATLLWWLAQSAA